MDPDYPDARRLAIFQDSSPAAALTHSSLVAPAVPEAYDVVVPVLRVDELDVFAAGSGPLPPPGPAPVRARADTSGARRERARTRRERTDASGNATSTGRHGLLPLHVGDDGSAERRRGPAPDARAARRVLRGYNHRVGPDPKFSTGCSGTRPLHARHLEGTQLSLVTAQVAWFERRYGAAVRGGPRRDGARADAADAADAAFRETVGCGRGVVLQKTPYFFGVSEWELFWPLTTGARPAP